MKNGQRHRHPCTEKVGAFLTIIKSEDFQIWNRQAFRNFKARFIRCNSGGRRFQVRSLTLCHLDKLAGRRQVFERHIKLAGHPNGIGGGHPEHFGKVNF